MKKLIVVVLLLAASAAGWYYYSAKESASETPTFVTTKVTRTDILQTVTATGALDPLLSVDVGSQISGLVKKLYVDFNSPVKKGDKLAEIDPATYEQRLRQANADLASAQASNKLSRLNATRTQDLHDKKLVTQQELDAALAQLAQSEATLQTREAALANAKVDLDRCTIFSPVDGIVLNKQTEEGKTVAASLNAPVLFTIANDLARMQITAAVSEADIGSVQVGQEVTFTVDAFPGRSFRGEVVQVRNAPKTVSNVVTYDTIINVNNADLRLRPGMTANVSVIVARRDKALRIPNSALRVRLPEGVTLANAPAPAANPAKKDAAPATDSAKKAPASAGTPSGRGEGRGDGQGGGRRSGMFGANLTPEQRQTVREIMQEVGVDFRAGPPSTEQQARIRQLMAERGLPVPEAEARPGEVVVTTRTVYVLRTPNGAPEAVTIKAGITDGSQTEVIDGLKEEDSVITAVTTASAGAAAGQQRPGTNNPFGPSGPRRF